MFKVPPQIYSRARCLPILASAKITDTVIGGSYGSLSVVQYGDITALVTALHVVEDLRGEFAQGKGAERIYSPLKPEWVTEELSRYDWRKISHPLDYGGGSRFDIAYAILSESQLADIDSRHIHSLANTSDIKSEFGAALQGYSGKYNKTANVRRRGAAKPMSCGFTTKLYPLAPYTVPMYDDFMYFKYTEQENDVWNNEKHYELGEKRPALAGLSGGPIFYLENRESNYAEVPPLSIIGFLLEHDKKSGMAKAVIADILIDRIQQPHEPRKTN